MEVYCDSGSIHIFCKNPFDENKTILSQELQSHFCRLGDRLQHFYSRNIAFNNIQHIYTEKYHHLINKRSKNNIYINMSVRHISIKCESISIIYKYNNFVMNYNKVYVEYFIKSNYHY